MWESQASRAGSSPLWRAALNGGLSNRRAAAGEKGTEQRNDAAGRGAGAQDLATTIYSFGKLFYKPRPEWLLRLQAVCLAKSDAFTEQALAISVWAILVLQAGASCGRLLATAVAHLLDAAQVTHL